MPFWRLYYHLVWSTKLRDPALHGEKVLELQRAIWKSAKDLKLHVHALGVQPDHVHFAFSAPPSLSVADIAQRIKGSSSHFLGKEFPGDWPGWQKEYGVVGFGQGSLLRVVEYVTHQDDHHRDDNLWLEMERGLEDAPPAAFSEIQVASNPSPNGTSDS